MLQYRFFRAKNRIVEFYQHANKGDKMKTSMSISALALLGALAPSLAMAATSTGTGHASAKVVEPVSITEDSQLNFGTMTNEPGTVEVSLSGNRYSTGDNLVDDATNPPSAARFSVLGPAGQHITVDAASGTTISASGSSMDVSLAWDSDADSNSTIPASGTLTIRVGGSLSPEGVAEGDYAGDYTITVNY